MHGKEVDGKDFMAGVTALPCRGICIGNQTKDGDYTGAVRLVYLYGVYGGELDVR